LASEYGWAFNDILETVYLDDLFFFMAQIKRRKLGEYKIYAAIIQNPHVKDPKILWNILKQEDDNYLSREFDEQGFNLLKDQLMQNPRFKVKEKC
jgi:hypothetical protein